MKATQLCLNQISSSNSKESVWGSTGVVLRFAGRRLLVQEIYQKNELYAGNPELGDRKHELGQGRLIFQNGQTMPRCNPKRQRGRALHGPRISSRSGTLALADASGYMKVQPSHFERLASPVSKSVRQLTFTAEADPLSAACCRSGWRFRSHAEELAHSCDVRFTPDERNLIEQRKLEQRKLGRGRDKLAGEYAVSPEALRKKVTRAIDRVAREVGWEGADDDRS